MTASQSASRIPGSCKAHWRRCAFQQDVHQGQLASALVLLHSADVCGVDGHQHLLQQLKRSGLHL